MAGHKVKFVAHDVGMVKPFVKRIDNLPSIQQMESLKKYGSFTNAFITNMKCFEGIPVRLAVLANELDKELVSYILQHPEWRVQCHGMNHKLYTDLPYEEVVKDFANAKRILDSVFHTSVSEYYPTFNKYDEITKAAAAACGMTEIRKFRRPGHYKRNHSHCNWMDFHYWSDENMAEVHKYLDWYNFAPTFIVGAPRSGTTALMRYMTDDDTVAIKENERIWKRKGGLRRYYLEMLNKTGKTKILDKNVRNSLRLDVIQQYFPSAKYVHLIRDGRAVTASWRKWAIKTNKPDQTVEGSVKQWVRYVNAVRSIELSNCVELRYEELCNGDSGYFVSRNYKWQHELSNTDIDIVYKYGGDLLKELGYV